MTVTSSLTYSEMLGRQIRTGDWQDQARTTFAKAVEALERGDGEDAAALAAYCVDECKVIYDIQHQWQEDLRGFLQEHGATEQEVRAAERRVKELLRLPDGTPYDKVAVWASFLESIERFQAQARSGQRAEAVETLAAARELWRIEHDRDGDWTYGLMDEVVTRFGEEVIPAMWQRIAGPLFAWRYAKFDVDQYDWDTEALPTLLYITLEAMRAHLSTPWRDDAPLELTEHDDRWEVRFDPCGSGGRIVRGDWVEETPSRMEPPYNWKVIERVYDWTDRKAGVCIYCNHCQVLMEHMSIDRFGYPVRVIEPPIYPDDDRENRQKCSWTIYKDPTAVPDEVYERCGRSKPTEFGSAAHASEPTDADATDFIGRG
jgi:hypothetical protein